MKVTLYRLSDGEFGPIILAPTEDALSVHLSEVVGFKLGGWQSSTHRVDPETGQIVPKQEG